MERFKEAARLFASGAPDAVKLCLRLAELESNWSQVAGAAIAERSSPACCEKTEDGLKITINVADAGVAQALKFRRAALVRALCRFMGSQSVKIDVRVGKVKKQSSAKPPLPAHKRRAPLIVSEKAVRDEIKRLTEENVGNEIAEIMARLKTASEKLKTRKNI